MKKCRNRGLELVCLYSEDGRCKAPQEAVRFSISPLTYLSILKLILILQLRTEMSPIYGKRLIVSLIDQYAADELEKLSASVPRNGEDLSQVFKNITYAQLANAINHASW